MREDEDGDPLRVLFSGIAIMLIIIGMGSVISAVVPLGEYLLHDGSRPLTGDWDVGGYSIIDLDEVDGKDVSGTHTKSLRLTTDAFGRPNTNPPAIIEQDNIILYSFNVDTEKIFIKFPIPSDYSTTAENGIVFHMMWTNDGDTDDNGKNVKWQFDYQCTTTGTIVAGDHANSPRSVTDTYSSATGWLLQMCDGITIPYSDFSSSNYIFIKLMAVTPTGDALSCEPHLSCICVVYTASNVDDGN